MNPAAAARHRRRRPEPAELALKCHNRRCMHPSQRTTVFTAPGWRRWLGAWGLSLNMAGPCAAVDSATPEAWRIMTERHLGNCIACHALPGQTGVRSTLGPSLQGVGTRYTAAQLMQWVTDARQIHPHTLMPPFGSASGLNRVASTEALLTPAQISQVVTALTEWR